MARSDLGTTKGLRQRCALFRGALADRGLTADLLKAHWPGGKDNPDTGLAGWVYCYGSYRTLLDGGRLDEAPESVEDTELEQARLTATRGAPRAVELTALDGERRSAFAYVHPKGIDATLQLEDADRYLSDLSQQLALAHAHRDNALVVEQDLVAKLLDEISYQHRLIISIICHPGASSPYDGMAGRPEPAPWTKELTITDVVSILEAHRDVNGARVLAARGLLLNEAGDGRRVSWTTLAVALAHERGVPSRDVMRHQDIPSIIHELSVLAERRRRDQTER